MKFTTNRKNQQKNKESIQTTYGLLINTSKAVICFKCKWYDSFPHLVLPDARSQCATHSHRINHQVNGSSCTSQNDTCFGWSLWSWDSRHIFGCPGSSPPMLNTLVELGHPQPSRGNPIEIDNSAAHDILTAKVCMKCSTAFDMCYYHQIKVRIAQDQFNLFWASCKQNHGDTTSLNTDPPAHHLLMHPLYTFTQPTMYLTSCEGVLVCTYTLSTADHDYMWLNVTGYFPHMMIF